MEVVIVSHKNKGPLQRIARKHKALSNLLSEEAEANTRIGALHVKRRGSVKTGRGQSRLAGGRDLQGTVAREKFLGPGGQRIFRKWKVIIQFFKDFSQHHAKKALW